jgi:hypothetical protein
MRVSTLRSFAHRAVAAAPAGSRSDTLSGRAPVFSGGKPMVRSPIAHLALIVFMIAFAAPGAVAPAAAALGSTYYQCTVNISGGTHNCTNGIVTITASSGVQRVARVDLSSSAYVRLDAFADVCNPTGWWLHFGDSPGDNGFGGDGGQTEHDAEAYNLGTNFQMFGTYNTSRFAYDIIYLSQGVAPASGCYRVQWTIYEDRVFFDNDGNPADSARVEVRSVFGFESAPYAEPDSEDPSGADANLWYVGMNRTVGTSSRSGTGVNKVCFVLSTTTSPSASLLSSLCP